MSFFSELKRRGVLGAVTAYGVVAAGALQVCDIVVHALAFPDWSMKAIVWASAGGFFITGFVSWTWDWTRKGFVRTEAPPARSPTPDAARAPVSPEALAAAAKLGPGATLSNGRYKIEREIGAGGMGRVLAASDTRLGRRVAIKIVTAAHDGARVRRFEQEARTAGALEHPNVLAVYDLGEEAGVPFLVTELLEGHTLRSKMAGKALAADEVRALGAQLARGLAAAHARGVVHRDLKPENLFVTSDGRLKILDFGLAKLMTPGDDSAPAQGGLTITGAIFGTPGYLSPEQARGESAGAPSDVFSAGAVLYELITGKRAFPGATLVEAAHAALTQEPAPLPESTPPALAAAVLRALQKDPARRFANGQELLAALEAERTPEPRALQELAHTLPASQPPPQPGMLRRSTALGLTAAGLALGAAVTSAILVQRVSGERRRFVLRDARSASSSHSERTPAEPPQPEAAPPAPPAARISPLVPAIPPMPPPGVDPDELREELDDTAQAALDQADLKRHLDEALRAGRLGALAGAWALYENGKLDRAERVLTKAIARAKDDVYSQLLLFIVKRRTGREAEARRELGQVVASMAGAPWPAALLRVYAGQLPHDQALALAEPGDPDRVRSRRCEAYFWLGLLEATASPPDVAAARRHYQQATAQNTPDLEAGFASQELARLDGR